MKINIKPSKISTSFKTEKIYPELEELTVTPSGQEQTFKSKMYGYDEVKVKGITAEVDEDIKPENIKVGVNILGVDGGYEGIDTSDATATAEDIIMNKTAYVNGEKIKGVIYPVYDTFYNTRAKEIDVGDTDVVASSSSGKGYYSVHNTDINMAIPFNDLANAIELTGDKIVEGNTIIGVEGARKIGIDTSDADATSDDIVAGKTAYVANEKIRGTYEPLDTSDATATSSDIAKDKTAYVNNEKVTGTMEINTNNAMIRPLIPAGNSRVYSQLFTMIQRLPEDSQINSSVTNASYMFANCVNLEYVPPLDMGNITNASNMIYYCSKLPNITLYNCSKITSFNSFASMCSSLEYVDIDDMSSVTDMLSMFSNCTALTDEGLNKIMKMVLTATSYTGTKTLKTLGLTSDQATRCATLSNYQAFLDAGWTSGF